MLTTITQKPAKSSLFILFAFLLLSCSEDPAEPTDGVDGQNGFNALVTVQDEPAGENCSSGGVKISVGQDANENGTLDDSEIESISFICNGHTGDSGSQLLARTSPETPGENCEAGGTLVEIGADADGNSVLENDEIQTSFFVCNGINSAGTGENGLTSLIIATPLEDCGPNNTTGIRIEIGLDDDGDGSLTGDEIDANYDICNGADGNDGGNGSNSLISVSSFSGSQGGCTNGGLVIRTGIDDNNDGSLQAGEVDATSYVCNGTNGSDGNSDGVYELYIYDGFNGYSGTIDVYIDEYDVETNFDGTGINVAFGDRIGMYGLIRFEKIEEEVRAITDNFEILDANLFLTGTSTGSNENYVGVKALNAAESYFDETKASFSSPDGSGVWLGDVSFDITADASGTFMDLHQLLPVSFEGVVPLQLNRTMVNNWITTPSSNYGLALEMASKSSPKAINIYDSENEDPYLRPVLYIKIQDLNTRGRTISITDQEYKANWKSMTYDEKLAPLKRIRD